MTLDLKQPTDVRPVIVVRTEVDPVVVALRDLPTHALVALWKESSSSDMELTNQIAGIEQYINKRSYNSEGEHLTQYSCSFTKAMKDAIIADLLGMTVWG